MKASFETSMRWYLWILMSGLFAQGLGSLIFRLIPDVAASAPYLIRGVLGIDIWHALIHIAWGSASIALLFSRPRQGVTWLALVFGVFYSLLGIAGVLIHDPFGLMLGGYENGFHLTVGPLTLLLGILAALHPGATTTLTA